MTNPILSPHNPPRDPSPPSYANKATGDAEIGSTLSNGDVFYAVAEDAWYKIEAGASVEISGGSGIPTYDTVSDMQADIDNGTLVEGDVAYVTAEASNYFVENGTAYPITDALVEVASLPVSASEGDLAVDRATHILYRWTSGAWVQISSPIDYTTLTALYDDADAGNLNAGDVCRIEWSGDAHVADGQIITQWTGTEFIPNPMTQVEFPSWLIESADWQLVNGQATGSLSFDADGRPIMTVDITTTGYGGVTTTTRYENAYSSFISRAELTDVDSLGTGAFNRMAPVALVGNAIDLGASFNPIFTMAGTLEPDGYFSNCRLDGGGYAETTAGLGRNWGASEFGKFILTVNNDNLDTSTGFAFGLQAGDKVDQIDSNNTGPELLEAPLALRPAMMSLLPNTGSGSSTAQCKLLGIKLASITHQTTDPRTY